MRPDIGQIVLIPTNDQSTISIRFVAQQMVPAQVSYSIALHRYDSAMT